MTDLCSVDLAALALILLPAGSMMALCQTTAAEREVDASGKDTLQRRERDSPDQRLPPTGSTPRDTAGAEEDRVASRNVPGKSYIQGKSPKP